VPVIFLTRLAPALDNWDPRVVDGIAAHHPPVDLSVIRQPVLVANGESDRMVPTANSVDLAQCLPDADLVIYPDAGHGGVFQFHEQFVDTALEFLAP